MARLVWWLILLSAGCAQLPEKPCPVCPPPPTKPAPERAQYVETSFAALPGWDSTQLEPSLRVRVAAERPLIVLASCHLVLQVSKLPFGGDEVGGA